MSTQLEQLIEQRDIVHAQIVAIGGIGIQSSSTEDKSVDKIKFADLRRQYDQLSKEISRLQNADAGRTYTFVGARKAHAY